MSKKEKVLIVGGGFGGVKAALTLKGNTHYEVTLLSDSDELRYYPALYQTATGSSRANSSIPLSTIFKDSDINIVRGVAETIDRKAKTITTVDRKSYSYDYLILGLGVVTNYFNIPGLSDYSFGIKSQSEAEEFKKHLHTQLIDSHKPDLNYVIVGAGPTGIELAGALPAYLNNIMKKHKLPKRNLHIDIVEAMPRLLPNLPKSTSRKVKRHLKKLGIKLFLGKAVQGETADSLTVSGKPIMSHTVIWTAGVTNHPFFNANKFVIMGRGKVGVDAYLQTEPNIFIIGDNANTPYSGMAQTAIHDGDFVANNLIRKSQGKDYKSYIVKKPITVIPAGPKWAVVIWGKLRLSGFIGYLLRQSADLRGFSELEPWPEAVKQFLNEFIAEDKCEVCALNQN